MRTPPTSPTAPTALPFSKNDPKRQHTILVAGVGGVALIAALVLLFVFRPWQPAAPPRLNDEPAKLAQLVASPAFDKLPFDQREVYMKVIDRKKSQMTQAYSAGRITDDEYRKALQAAHLGKRLDEMHKYFSRPAGRAREAYLDKMIDKDAKQKAALSRDPTARKEKKEEKIPRDSSDEEAEINRWPPEIRAQYGQFKASLNDRRKLYKELHPTKSAATQPAAATKPAPVAPGND
jgi:hypothetical protein